MAFDRLWQRIGKLALVAEAVDPSPVAEDDALSGASQAALTAGPAQPLDASMREAEKANAPL